MIPAQGKAPLDPRMAATPPTPCVRAAGHPLPFPVDMWQGLLGRVSQLPVELGEVQLFGLQVPGGTTRGREKVSK